jgi:hypothetical protein
MSGIPALHLAHCCTSNTSSDPVLKPAREQVLAFDCNIGDDAPLHHFVCQTCCALFDIIPHAPRAPLPLQLGPKGLEFGKYSIDYVSCFILNVFLDW